MDDPDGLGHPRFAASVVVTDLAVMWVRVLSGPLPHPRFERTADPARCACGARVAYAVGPIIDLMPDADVTCTGCRAKASGRPGEHRRPHLSEFRP
jgi:hypothetical protein